MNSKNIARRTLLLLFSIVCAAYSHAQSVVQGSVKDASGEPLIGATVQVKGVQGGTVTDINGHYVLSDVKNNATLVFSYIGYRNKEVAVGHQTTVNVSLEMDHQQLDEIVVVGYAVGTKRTVSGAIDRIGKADMNKGVVTSASDALKGKVSGVVISQNGGDPMGTTSIRVRGTSSLSGGNDPLVIIDGVFADMTMFNALQPGDIESMTILKDASETAQYGSRGAAGVIVVTTTKGRNGFSSINYSGTFGVNTVYKNLKMLNAADYRATATRLGIAFTDLGGNSNWFDEIERSVGLTQNHNVSFSSGNDTGNYRASLGFIQREGALKNSDMKNYTAKLDAMQYAFNKRLKLELGIFGSERDGKMQYDPQKMFYSAAAYNPTYPTYKNKNTGEWDEDRLANEIYNPMGQLEVTDRYDVGSLNVHGKVTYTLLDGLFLSAFGSYTRLNLDHKRYVPNDIQQGRINGNGWAYIKNIKRTDLMGNLQLTYTKDFGKHHIDALALMEGQQYKSFENMGQAFKFDTNYFGYNNMQSGANVSWGDVTSEAKEYKLMSYMARLNYMFADKYIATVNLRTDGSSKLGKGHKWGWFPSASVAWVVSQENFMKNAKWIDNLKVRMGYGVTGNQDVIEPYQSLALYGPNGVTTVNGAKSTTYAILSNDNPDLKWEVKQTFDVGVDFSAFKNRLNVTLDWYTSTTKDLLYLYTVPVPPFTYNTLLANMGKMTNMGFEIGVRGDIVRSKDFTFNSGLNLSFQKNKLNSLSGYYKGQLLTTSEHIAVANINAAGLTQNTGVSYLIEGQPIGVFYLPHSEGINANGQYVISDLDHNKTIDTGDSGDRKVCGQAIPKAYLGWNFTFKYKNWDMTMQFNGAFGHKIYNGTGMTYSNMNNFPTYNVLAEAPQKGIKDIQISDYWLEKGDYVNFEYVTLGYTFGKKQLKANWIQSLHLGLSVNNVYMFTGYKGLSPLINSTSLVRVDEGRTTYGTIGVDDKRLYPLSRTFSFNVSVTF